MSIGTAITLFLGCLVLSAISSAVLSHRLDQVGTHLGLSEGLLGLVTALGADSPEIATAVTALAGAQHDLGSGVIFGSNVFNLAGLFGLGALVAGDRVRSRDAAPQRWGGDRRHRRAGVAKADGRHPIDRRGTASRDHAALRRHLGDEAVMVPSSLSGVAARCSGACWAARYSPRCCSCGGRC